MKTAETTSSTSTLPTLPARGTLRKNVHPYKMGKGTIEKIEGFLKAGVTVVFQGMDIRTDIEAEPVTLFIFKAEGESYGIKAEDVELLN